MPTHILFNDAFKVDDRILLGEGLFETIRVHRSLPCYSKLHWQRLSHSAQLLEIPFDLAFNVWQEKLLHCIKKAKLETGGIKVILSGGSAPRGLIARSDTPCLSFEAFNYVYQEKSLTLVNAAWLRDANNPIYQHKTVNYLESILARRQAVAAGADDALFFNMKGHATETTVASFFIIQKDKIYTPKLADGLLPGITRCRLLNLANQSGIICGEISITKAMIEEAEAVFVTNALQGVLPVKLFNKFEKNTHHPLITELRHLLDNDENF